MLDRVRRYELPRSLADECLQAIRKRGRNGNELFIALTAILADGGSTVRFRRGLIPRQACHRTPSGLLVTIDGDAIFDLNRNCYERGEVLAGQIHGHPGRAYHSGADDQLAIVRRPGGLSIVVPDFADARSSRGRWAIYRLDGRGAWSPISAATTVELT